MRAASFLSGPAELIESDVRSGLARDLLGAASATVAIMVIRASAATKRIMGTVTCLSQGSSHYLVARPGGRAVGSTSATGPRSLCAAEPSGGTARSAFLHRRRKAAPGEAGAAISALLLATSPHAGPTPIPTGPIPNAEADAGRVVVVRTAVSDVPTWRIVGTRVHGYIITRRVVVVGASRVADVIGRRIGVETARAIAIVRGRYAGAHTNGALAISQSLATPIAIAAFTRITLCNHCSARSARS